MRKFFLLAVCVTFISVVTTQAQDKEKDKQKIRLKAVEM